MKNPTGILLLVAAVSTPVVADDCTAMTQALAQMSERFIELVDDSGDTVLLRVKVADESNEQAAGFQHICADTIESTAILFVFEKPKQPLFHMRNVHANLDIAFIDEQGKVGDIQLMNEEISTGVSRLYPSTVLAKYALEVREGFFGEHNITSKNSRMKIDE